MSVEHFQWEAAFFLSSSLHIFVLPTTWVGFFWMESMPWHHCNLKGLCEAFVVSTTQDATHQQGGLLWGRTIDKSRAGGEIKGSRPGENLIITDISHLKEKPFREGTGGHCSITEEGEGMGEEGVGVERGAEQSPEWVVAPGCRLRGAKHANN